MNLLTWTYVAYLAVSAAVTVWVAQTLYARGRPFLVNNFHGDELLADSVNHLLVVGFYLLNFGYVALALKYGDKPTDLQTAVEFLATKLGLVLVILGVMHFFNLYVFARIGRPKALPPVRAESPFAPANYQQLRGAVLHAAQNRNE
jgi:hypothetical protein